MNTNRKILNHIKRKVNERRLRNEVSKILDVSLPEIVNFTENAAAHDKVQDTVIANLGAKAPTDESRDELDSEYRRTLPELDVRKTHGDKRIENPSTGNAIKLRTALKAKKGTAAYAKGKAMYNSLKDKPANEVVTSKLEKLKELLGDDELSENGIMYTAGVKKYGKEGMTKIQSAAGKGENHEEIGKIKDKYEKGKNESADLTEDHIPQIADDRKYTAEFRKKYGTQKTNKFLSFEIEPLAGSGHFNFRDIAKLAKKNKFGIWDTVRLVNKVYVNQVKGVPTNVKNEGKLTEAKDRKLDKLFQRSRAVTAKSGEDKLYKLSQDWEDWNVDNDDKYDDLVDHLFAAVELVQDAGTVKDKEYYSYMKSADKHLKTFTKDVTKAMKLHKEGKLTENHFKKGQRVKYQLDRGSSKALKPSSGTISNIKKMGKYYQYTIQDGGPVPVWGAEIIELAEGKVNEDYSQRARNFRVNLRKRLIGMKKGQKVSYGKAQYVKMVDGNFQIPKTGKVYGVEELVQAMKHAVKPDILKHRGVAGADMVNAYLKFEGKVTEAKGGWALYIDGEKIKSFRSKREALRALQLVQLSDNSVKLKKEGKLYEEVNWYVSIARTVRVKTLKGKTVTLKKGDQGYTEKKSWGDTRVYIDDYVFDADQFKNDDLDLHDKPIRG